MQRPLPSSQSARASSSEALGPASTRRSPLDHTTTSCWASRGRSSAPSRSVSHTAYARFKEASADSYVPRLLAVSPSSSTNRRRGESRVENDRGGENGPLPHTLTPRTRQ